MPKGLRKVWSFLVIIEVHVTGFLKTILKTLKQTSKSCCNSGNYSNLNFSQTVFQDLETQFRVAAELPFSKEVTVQILGFDIHSCAKSTKAHQSDSLVRQTRSWMWKRTPASPNPGKAG